jgi:hypothetical protein
MRKAKVVFLLILVCGLFAPYAVQAQQSNKYAVAGIDDATEAEKFFLHLQTIVAKDDRQAVADAINYPITVKVKGRRVKLRSKAELLRQYAAVFNQQVKQALAKQQAGDLFVNYQGVMIGRGEIWFNQLPDRQVLKIIAINN